MARSDLVERLAALETELHRFETRQNRDRLDQLLHPDFVEFARSGHRYSRGEVLAEFAAADATLEPVRAENFVLGDARFAFDSAEFSPLEVLFFDVLAGSSAANQLSASGINS